MFPSPTIGLIQPYFRPSAPQLDLHPSTTINIIDSLILSVTLIKNVKFEKCNFFLNKCKIIKNIFYVK